MGIHMKYLYKPWPRMQWKIWHRCTILITWFFLHLQSVHQGVCLFSAEMRQYFINFFSVLCWTQKVFHSNNKCIQYLRRITSCLHSYTGKKVIPEEIRKHYWWWWRCQIFREGPCNVDKEQIWQILWCTTYQKGTKSQA